MLNMPRLSAVATLRESFGDRKLPIPEISRKITACVACRKLKIKCHMLDDRPPCSRCRSRNISCTVNKSLQALLESDASWKEEMEERIAKLEQALADPGRLAQSQTAGTVPEAGSSINPPKRLRDTAQLPQSEPDQGQTAALNLSSSLGAFPASSITPQQKTSWRLQSSTPDIVDRGVITFHQATECFDFYKRYLDVHMFYLLMPDDTLSNVRTRSPLLISAICAVACFCAGLEHYEACLRSFVSDVSEKLFAARYDFDDVRALCAGALWLNDISSALNGLAVRINTQLDLHRCITKMPHIKKDCYDRTRLYFQVYLCDHQCSLVYGRPPMTTEFRSLKGPDTFLQSTYACAADISLLSQVDLWSIQRRIFNIFGSDIEGGTIVKQRWTELKRLHNALDSWHRDWIADSQVGNIEISTRLRPTFDMYHHSAKLYLFSHVYRGASLAEPPAGLGQGHEFVQQATESALSILRCVIEMGSRDKLWVGTLPLYLGTTIAFASVCLIRTTIQSTTALAAKRNEAVECLHNLAQILRASQFVDGSSHPLSCIARGLEAAITRQSQEPSAPDETHGNEDTLGFAFDFDAFASDPWALDFPGAEDKWMFCPEEMNVAGNLHIL